MSAAQRRYPFRKLVVFISNRVEQDFAGTTLEAVRVELTEQLLRLDELRRWLTASREGERLARRARARATIARTLAEQVEVGE